MNKNLIMTALTFLTIGTSNAMYMSLPNAEYLKRALCNAGYRTLVEQTDLIKNLAGKPYAPVAVYNAVQSATNQLAQKQPAISKETLENHLPAITAIVLKDSRTALDELIVLNLLNAFALEKLARIATDKDYVKELHQRTLQAKS